MKEIAIFAGGCFWCMEAAFRDMKGIQRVVSGYTGGTVENPSYEQVCSGITGHYEAIKIEFDSNKISYKELADFFVKQIDPTDPDGQFVDRGPQYKSAIFYHDEKQKQTAKKTLKELQKYFDKKIVTEILPTKKFYEAEEHHQNYSQKNKIQYNLYSMGTGRKKFLKKVWK